MGEVATTIPEQKAAPEKTFSRLDLQAHLLSFPEKFSKDSTLIGEKLRGSFASRWSWDLFNKASQQERGEEGASTVEEWEKKVIEWHQSLDKNSPQGQRVQEILSALGVSEVNNSTLQNLLDEYSNSQEGIKLFIEKVLLLEEVENKMQMVKCVAGMLFGRKIAAEIASQVIDLEKNIVKCGANETELINLEKELMDAGKKPSVETLDLIARMERLLEKNKESNSDSVEQERDSTTQDFSESKEIETANGAFLSDIGRGRYEQQDEGFLEEGGLPEGLEAIAAITDGHGEGGAEASRIVAESFREQIIELLKNGSSLSIGEAIKQALKYSENEIYGRVASSGSTIVAAIKTKDKIYIANVGDSRAYAISTDGQMSQVTKDHRWQSVVYKYGIQLSRTLGDLGSKQESEGEITSEPDIITLDSSEVDSLILLTDGVTNVLSEEEIKELLKGSPKEIASSIIKAAKLKDQLNDNVTVAVLRMT